MFNITTTKNTVMSFKPLTEKIKKKKIGICSILGRIRIQNRTRIRIHHPGSGSAVSNLEVSLIVIILLNGQPVYFYLIVSNHQFFRTSGWVYIE